MNGGELPLMDDDAQLMQLKMQFLLLSSVSLKFPLHFLLSVVFLFLYQN